MSQGGAVSEERANTGRPLGVPRWKLSAIRRAHCVGRELTSPAIARRLGISLCTVEHLIRVLASGGFVPGVRATQASYVERAVRLRRRLQRKVMAHRLGLSYHHYSNLCSNHLHRRSKAP